MNSAKLILSRMLASGFFLVSAGAFAAWYQTCQSIPENPGTDKSNCSSENGCDGECIIQTSSGGGVCVEAGPVNWCVAGPSIIVSYTKTRYNCVLAQGGGCDCGGNQQGLPITYKVVSNCTPPNN
jgi:hypothetical protein